MLRLHRSAIAGRESFQLVLSLLPTEPKVLVSLPPRVVSAAMMATATSAAIRPYSIAVAPDSSERKRFKLLRIVQGPTIYEVKDRA